MGRSVHPIKENVEGLMVVTKGTGIEVNADKTKYMVVPRDHNAERSHSMRTDKSCFERVEECKYFGTTSKNQNPIQDKV